MASEETIRKAEKEYLKEKAAADRELEAAKVRHADRISTAKIHARQMGVFI